MSAVSPVLVLVGLVVVLAVAAGLAVVVTRSARSRRRVPGAGILQPVAGSGYSFDAGLRGPRGLVSVGPFTTAGAPGSGPSGTVHLHAVVGPDWPVITVRPRAASARDSSADAGMREQPTGDAAFDARYVVHTTAPDPRAVLAVLDPALRAHALDGEIASWRIGPDLLRLEVTYREPEAGAAAAGWAGGLVAHVLVMSGFSVPGLRRPRS